MRAMRRALSMFGLTLGLALAACGGEGGASATVTLGSVAADGVTFAPLDGDQTLVPGSQGGFHVWVKFRFENIAPGKVTLERTARRTRDDRLVLTTKTNMQLGEPDADGAWETPDPLPSFMCPTPIGISVIDEPIRFEVKVLDEQGHELANDAHVATPHCPDGEQSQFCHQICSG